MGAFGFGGAAVTALAFYVGAQSWGWVVLALFGVTLLAGLAVKFGLHRFSVGLLLNIWFVVAVVLPGSYHADRIKTNGWHQALAWLIGSALWIALTGVVWLASRRKWRPRPVIDLPGEPFSSVDLTRPVVLFALIRALALAASAAIAFGLHEPDADWMVIATLIAMKPSIEQSRLVGLQRVIGAALGAAVAIPILLTVHNRDALEVTIILLVAIGAFIHGVNYAYYTAAIASAALIAADLPHPTNYASERRRVLFTFIGVGIGVVVMFIADRMQKRSANAAPSPM
ncbi:MAG: FUSC family protein [Acidimicrobiales bacterium]